MAMSLGLQVDDEVMDIFGKVKTYHAPPWVTFKLNTRQTSVILDIVSKPTDGYRELLQALEASGEPRFALFASPKEWSSTEKVALISWILNDAPLKTKMAYNSFQPLLKKELEGVHVIIDIHDKNESIKDRLLPHLK